jgi:hypothetical protein
MTSAAASSYEAEQTLAASADRVWALLSDLANPEVAAGFVRVTVEGSGRGAVRTLVLAPEQGGGVVIERIEAFEPAARSYRYRVLEPGPLPFADYAGQLGVVPANDAEALLTYRATYRPSRPADEAHCRRIAAGSFAQLAANLARVLAGSAGR